MAATILILEDDVVLRELLSEVLEDEGYSIIAADSLQQLLAIAPRHADLLITDVFLKSGVGGLHAIEQVRRVTHNQLPALICTAAKLEQIGSNRDIERLGAKILPKPFSIDELVTYVRSALPQAQLRAAPMIMPVVFA